ncbi:hypothetical protein ACFLZG_06630 [Thermodesulfobacteriota bacterium]
MAWIQRISHLDQSQKEGFYRTLIPPSLYHRLGINPLNFRDDKGLKVVRFFCPEGDRTCLVEIKLEDIEDPVYSIQLSDSTDPTVIEWDFLVVNDPWSEKFNTHIDKEGKDTLFGWASRNLVEEERAMEAGYFPGQTRRGFRLTGETIQVLDLFCRILDIKSIRLEALFYHNAITFERHGFSYFDGYKQMKRIHELFQPGGELFEKSDNSTPFRKPEFAQIVRGRSWVIHDGILGDIECGLLDEGWVSPVMYRMVEKPRSMTTFPDPIY